MGFVHRKGKRSLKFSIFSRFSFDFCFCFLTSNNEKKRKIRKGTL
jgi:hypothetical protein